MKEYDSMESQNVKELYAEIPSFKGIEKEKLWVQSVPANR